MRTVGQILKEERERKFYTIEEIEKATKIRKELLEALEAGDYLKLPPPTFVQGFIKNYAKFLGLGSENLLAIFRGEFSDRKNPPQILESFANPLTKNKFRLTPTRVLSGLVMVLLLLFFLYLWFEYRFLVGPPFLEVREPQDQAQVEGEVVKVTGKTNPEAKVDINNQQVAVDIAGNFSEDLTLTESVSTITVTATSKSGQSVSEKKTVFLKR